MRHGNLDRDTALGLKELRRRLEADGNRVPPSILDETMNLATWNIREFGRRPRLPKSLHYIAEVIGRFDLVALTEVRRDLSDLLRVMELLPPFRDFVVSDYSSDRAANKERVAYVFDKREVRFAGLVVEAAPQEERAGPVRAEFHLVARPIYCFGSLGQLRLGCRNSPPAMGKRNASCL